MECIPKLTYLEWSLIESALEQHIKGSFLANTNTWQEILSKVNELKNKTK